MTESLFSPLLGKENPISRTFPPLPTILSQKVIGFENKADTHSPALSPFSFPGSELIQVQVLFRLPMLLI